MQPRGTKTRLVDLSPALLQLMEDVVEPERLTSYEMFRVEVVETGGSRRMARLLDMKTAEAESLLLRVLPNQLACDLAGGHVSRIVERTRLDLLLTLAISLADLPEKQRPVFYLVCDIVAIHCEMRGIVHTDPVDHHSSARRYLVGELARVQSWYAREVTRGHH